MSKRRGIKQPGTPVTIYLNCRDSQSFLLAAQRENITLEEAVHKVCQGRVEIREALQKLPQFMNRLCTMAEGSAVILSLIQAEVARHKDEQLEKQVRSMMSNRNIGDLQ